MDNLQFEDTEEYYIEDDCICQYCFSDSDECNCDENACCYEVGYIGDPGTCFCADSVKSEERAKHWFYSRYDMLRWWISNRYYKLKWKFKELFSTRECDCCDKKTWNVLWSSDECPKCREWNLPF